MPTSPPFPDADQPSRSLLPYPGNGKLPSPQPSTGEGQQQDESGGDEIARRMKRPDGDLP
ncbi:hypothetical protein TIFTF001_053572 [Ficus carica]|uniref:Uncharacterized protein n=1 Tax=Ficus carica TaxID=3494 RepID=A0AA88EEG8_FICCA|nr:hypothetical protein TIFTF001_053572 [Ficus carica]